jgi:hypothetical protein
VVSPGGAGAGVNAGPDAGDVCTGGAFTSSNTLSGGFIGTNVSFTGISFFIYSNNLPNPLNELIKLI